MVSNEILDRLMVYLDVKTDAALAQKLGYKNQSTLGNWRIRNTIDLDRILEAAPGIDLNWLIKGITPLSAQPASDREYVLLREQIDRLQFEKTEYWNLIKELTKK